MQKILLALDGYKQTSKQRIHFSEKGVELLQDVSTEEHAPVLEFIDFSEHSTGQIDLALEISKLRVDSNRNLVLRI